MFPFCQLDIDGRLWYDVLMMTKQKYYRDIDCYGTYEVEVPDPTNSDEWTTFIFEIGYYCHDMGHRGYFDPISGAGEGPCGPELEEAEWTLYWEDGTRTSPPWNVLARIIPYFHDVVESCYESAVYELRNGDY